MSKLLASIMICGSLAMTGAPASVQVAAPPANADAVRANVARAYDDASRIVGLVSAATTDPRIPEMKSFADLAAILDQKAAEIASARAEVTAINNRILGVRQAVSSETEDGRQARRLLDDLGAFAASASHLLQQVDEMRAAFHSNDLRREQRIRDNLGALRAGPIVSLEWANILYGGQAAGFPQPSRAYALNGGLGCYYRGLALIHRADARLSPPSVAGASVSNAAGCLERMIDMADRAPADAATPQEALDVLEAAAALLERAAGDLRDAPDGTEILPGYNAELQSIQARVNALYAADGQ